MDKNSDFNNIYGQNQDPNPDNFQTSFTDVNGEKFILEGEEYEFVTTGQDSSTEQKQTENKDDAKQKNEDQNNKETNESGSHEQDGKYFVIQKGLACCDKGAKFPQFKVTSQKKHFWNNEKDEADYLAVTEDDLTFNPTAMPFGTCSIKNGNSCTYSPSGKWTKTYDKIRIMNKKPITELSELLCAVGGKITVMKHGQQIEAGKNNVSKADTREQQTYNPLMDFEEFKEETSQSDQLYYE